MTGRVAGKVAFITGAARGQGRSHAVRLAEEGADIIATDICRQMESVSYPLATEADLAETVRLVAERGRRVFAAPADVRDLAGLMSVVDQGVAELGRLDIVAANAGISSIGKTFRMDEQLWRDMIDVNLTGVWNTVRASAQRIIEGGRGGSIVLTSSAAGLRGSQNIGHYVAAKHGVVGLMKTLALELAGYHIRVNCLLPTSVDTDMIRNDRTYRLFRPDLPAPTRDDMGEAFASLNALPVPWIEPRDVSDALVFLVSDESRYVTGVPMPVDAGMLIK